ncbi:acyl-CoA desaturase [Pseudokineococcus marinus]
MHPSPALSGPALPGPALTGPALTGSAPPSPAAGPAAVGGRPRERQVSSYRELSRRVRAAGLLERRRADYWRRIVLTALAWTAVVAAAALLRDSWLVLLAAGALALVTTQMAFLGHDGAHRQVFASARANEVAGRVFASLMTGLSYGWWTGKHTRHHQAPNQVGVDGDLDSKALAFTPEAARARRGPRAWITRHQGWLFFPLLLLQGLNLHVDSTRRLLGRRALPRRRVEVALVAAHWAAAASLLLLLLPPGRAAAFAGVHLAVLGVAMGLAFAPNHVGMPVVPRGAKVDFLQRQVLMSRDVRGGPLVDLAMGGLNYQVEHHLFPSMPRANLRQAQVLVRAYCAEQGVLYTETSVLGAYRAVVGHLHRVGVHAPGTFSCPLARELR